MTLPLLRFPPEILVTILSFLPVRALLRFSQTCHYSHCLATSSLHSLSLGIYTSRISGIVSCLSATQFPEPKNIASAFSSGNHPIYSSSRFRSVYLDDKELQSLTEAEISTGDPFTVPISIPDAEKYDPATLLAFHSALIESVLKRHGATLRKLELTLWTLTVPVAKALASMPALRSLSIRIEDFPQARGFPRLCAMSRRSEEREAWRILTQTAVWAPQMQALRIEGGELSSTQLSDLLRRSRWCRELWLCKCSLIGEGLWRFIGDEWENGRSALRILGVMRCGGQIDEETLDVIGSLHGLQVSVIILHPVRGSTARRGMLTGLQFLSLQGCYGLGNEVIEQRNKTSWGFLEVIPPTQRAKAPDVSPVIEVDPLYMQEDD
jgi:hypothetical protein